MMDYMRSYCKIDLDAIRTNIRNIREKAGEGPLLMAVIKADAYGHGACRVGHALEDLVDYYGVATIEEAVELRQDGLTLPILILGYNSPSLYSLNLTYDVDQTIYSLETAKAMSEQAVAMNKTARIHIALDTGMTRIGIMPTEEGREIVKEIAALPGVKLQGMFTHFSCADMTDKVYTHEQMERYDHFVDLLKEVGIEIPVKHVCNSAAIMEFDHHRYDMVRSGIVTYGLYPSDEVDMTSVELHPAMSWYAHVVNIMEPEMNRGVSYGATYVTDHPCRLATISIGYADGYPRSLSNKGWVLIRGKKAPIVGRVCMDQMMVDISEIDGVEIEDIVTLIGSDGDEHISVEEMAGLAGSFNYEFVCGVSKRVKRVYLSRGPISD